MQLDIYQICGGRWQQAPEKNLVVVKDKVVVASVVVHYDLVQPWSSTHSSHESRCLLSNSHPWCEDVLKTNIWDDFEYYFGRQRTQTLVEPLLGVEVMRAHVFELGLICDGVFGGGILDVAIVHFNIHNDRVGDNRTINKLEDSTLWYRWWCSSR